MSSTATTRAVAARSRKSAPSNAAAVSAANPGPPVSWALMPSSRPSATASLISDTRSLAAPPERNWASTGTSMRAAAPSSDGMGPSAGAPTTSAMRSPAPTAAAMPSGPSSPPSSRVTTRTAGTDSEPGNSRWISETRAASESSGSVCGPCDEPSDEAKANTAPLTRSTTTSINHAESLPETTPTHPSADPDRPVDPGFSAADRSALIGSLVFTRRIRRGTPRGWW